MKIPPDACPICHAVLAEGSSCCGHCGFENLPSPLTAPPRRGQALDPLLAALAAWRERADREPDDWRWPFLVGVACLNLDLPEDAIGELRLAAALAPGLADTHLVLAGALVFDPYRIDDDAADEARAAVAQALELQAGLPAALALQRLLLVHARRGQPQMAELLLRDAITNWPACAVFPYQLAELLATGEEFEEAETVLNEAIVGGRDTLLLHVGLGLLFWRQGRYVDGRDSVLPALELTASARARDVAMVHSTIALCMFGLRDDARARMHLERALALDPGNTAILANIDALSASVAARHRSSVRRRWLAAVAAACAALAVLVATQAAVTGPGASPAAGLEQPPAGVQPADAAPPLVSVPHRDEVAYLIRRFEAGSGGRKVHHYQLTTLNHGYVTATDAGYKQSGKVGATLACFTMVTVDVHAPKAGELPVSLCGYAVDAPPGNRTRIWWGDSASELMPLMEGQGFHLIPGTAIASASGAAPSHPPR